MKLTSLTYRLVLWFILIALLPLSLFSYLSLRQSEDALRSESLARMSRLADKKTLEIKTYLAERSQNAQLLARGRLVEEAMTGLADAYSRYRPDSAEYNRAAGRIHDYFADYIDEISLFYDAFLITPQGEIVYSYRHEPDFATNLLDGPYRNSQLAKAFRESSVTLESAISDFELYAPTNAPAAFVSAPIFRSGMFKGVVALQLNTEHIYQVAMDPGGLGATGETLLAKLTATGEGLFVAPLRHDPQAAMQRKIDMKTTSVPIRLGLAGESGSGIEVDYSGRQVVAAWRYVPELRWGIVVKMDTDEAFALIYRQRKVLMETLLALAVSGGLFAFYFGRRMVVSLKTFARTADEIAKGDLDKRVDEIRADEIGALGRAFNRMTENLNALYGTLESRIEMRTRELRASNEQLQQEIDERKRIEAELKNSRDQYDRLTTNIPVGVYLARTAATGELSLKYVSARFCAMLGVTAEAAYADPLSAFQAAIHPDDLADFVKMNQAATQTRELYLWEGRTRVKGVTRWLRIESRPEPLDNGDCIWDGVMVDITGKKLAELELQHKQDLLNEAQRLGKLGSWELDVASGTLNWSDEIYRIFELDPAEFSPSYENFLNAIHPDDRAKVDQAYRRALEDRQPYDITHRLRFADGRVKWVREHCISEFDASGKALRSVGAVQDITEHKLAEDHLRIAAATFETHEAIVITDKNANIIRVNQAFQDITGYRPEEVLGKNPRILSSGRKDKSFYSEMWRQLLTAGSWTGELWDKGKDGFTRSG